MKCLTESLDVCESVLKIQGMDWPVLLSPNTLAMLTIAATLQDHVESKVSMFYMYHKLPHWLLFVKENSLKICQVSAVDRYIERLVCNNRVIPGAFTL